MVEETDKKAIEDGDMAQLTGDSSESNRDVFPAGKEKDSDAALDSEAGKDLSDTAATNQNNQRASEVVTDVGGASDTGAEMQANAAQSQAEKQEAMSEYTPEKMPAKKSNKVAWFAFFLALAAFIGSAYLGWELLQRQEKERATASIVEQHHEQLMALQSAVAADRKQLEQKIFQRDEQISRLKQSLVETGLSIDAHARRLLSLTATTTDDWRLAEVEYLLRLANQRILTSKDASTAINLLEAADQILLELADPRLFKLRKAIASDKAALATVGEFDVDGVFLELAALSEQVNALEALLLPKFEPDEVGGEQSDAMEAASQPAWLLKVSEVLKNTWEELRSLIVIQQIDTPVKPLLPPDQQFYLKNNLRLLISQAQLALLDGRQQVYAKSLTTAANWVEEFFPNHHPANSAMLHSLRRLSGLRISGQYPDASDSLLAITAFIKNQHRMAAGEPGATEKAASDPE